MFYMKKVSLDADGAAVFYEMGSLFLLAVSVFAVCTEALRRHKLPSHLSNRPIVGGVDADISSFPYQVSLAYVSYDSGEKRIQHNCGGSIISVDWVLTAAHCVHNLSPSDMLVNVGTSTLDKTGSSHAVTKIISHDEFNTDVTLDYDIALLKVAQPFEIGPNVKPIPLNKNPLRPGEIIVLSGWGHTSEGGEVVNNLQKVEVPVVPQWECRWLYGHGKLSDNMFCGGRTGRDTCQGDSGGPAVANGILVGVVSWGEGCARPGYPGIYSNVEKLRKWIFSNSGV